jgi:hypothetical protein
MRIKMDTNDLSKRFDMWVDKARSWIGKRKRFRNVYIARYNYHHSSKNKALFTVHGVTHFIELYKPALIKHYLTYYPEHISFELYLISIALHECVHRQQLIKDFKNNYKLFFSMYECYPEKYENPARNAEKRFVEYMLKYGGKE